MEKETQGRPSVAQGKGVSYLSARYNTENNDSNDNNDRLSLAMSSRTTPPPPQITVAFKNSTFIFLL